MKSRHAALAALLVGAILAAAFMQRLGPDALQALRADNPEREFLG